MKRELRMSKEVALYLVGSGDVSIDFLFCQRDSAKGEAVLRLAGKRMGQPALIHEEEERLMMFAERVSRPVLEATARLHTPVTTLEFSKFLRLKPLVPTRAGISVKTRSLQQYLKRAQDTGRLCEFCSSP
jgi:hypothetical protein